MKRGGDWPSKKTRLLSSKGNAKRTREKLTAVGFKDTRKEGTRKAICPFPQPRMLSVIQKIGLPSYINSEDLLLLTPHSFLQPLTPSPGGQNTTLQRERFTERKGNPLSHRGLY